MSAARKRRRGAKRCWSYTAGQPPFTVQVHERAPGGVLYERMWDPSAVRAAKGGTVRRGAQVRVSLGHRDREAAIRHAEDEARKLRAGAEAMGGRPTLAGVLSLYLAHRSPEKRSAESRADDVRRAQLWTRLYGERLVAELGEVEWNEFKRLRSSGAIDARGVAVPDVTAEVAGKRRPLRRAVGPRAVDGDLVFLNAVLNWAIGFKVKGRALVEGNPFGAPAPGVRRQLERPRNRSPRKPVATYDRFLAVREAAEQVMTAARKGEPGAALVEVGRAQFVRGEGPVRLWMKPSYLPELLDLVEATGRRIGAIARLWYSDFIREGGSTGPVTKVRWRPFKGEDEQVVPIAERARAAVERILARRPGVGDVFVFPAPGDATKCVTRQLARQWLLKAEAIAGVPHLDGGSFHPYRRKWATERKHLPTADVMRAGGWKDDRSLKGSYQMADDETVLDVVNEPRKLLERRAGGRR